MEPVKDRIKNYKEDLLYHQYNRGAKGDEEGFEPSWESTALKGLQRGLSTFQEFVNAKRAAGLIDNETDEKFNYYIFILRESASNLCIDLYNKGCDSTKGCVSTAGCDSTGDK